MARATRPNPDVSAIPVSIKGAVILLDMDGVVTQFVAAAIRLHGLDVGAVLAGWPKGEYRIEEICHRTPREFWGLIEEYSPAFWRDLDPYPYFEPFYRALCGRGEVVFCTSPGWDADASKGKVEWLQDRFGKNFRNYIITNQKHLMAGPGRFLIDDFGKQCDEFNAAGGRAVLFPRVWNDGPVLEGDEAVFYVLDVLDRELYAARELLA